MDLIYLQKVLVLKYNQIQILPGYARYRFPQTSLTTYVAQNCPSSERREEGLKYSIAKAMISYHSNSRKWIVVVVNYLDNLITASFVRCGLFFGQLVLQLYPLSYRGHGRSEVPAMSSVRVWVYLVVIFIMTPLEDFKQILKEKGVDVPEESLVMLRDMVDSQTEYILDSWYEVKNKNNV